MANRRQGRLNRAWDSNGWPGSDEIVELDPEIGFSDAGPPRVDASGSRTADPQFTTSDQGAQVHKSSGNQPTVEVVRLSVNLLPDSAVTLKTLCRRNGLNLTEGIKRAIKLWKIVDDTTLEGGRVLVESSGPPGEHTYREIVFV